MTKFKFFKCKALAHLESYKVNHCLKENAIPDVQRSPIMLQMNSYEKEKQTNYM